MSQLQENPLRTESICFSSWFSAWNDKKNNMEAGEDQFGKN